MAEAAPPSSAGMLTSPAKEINIATLCRFGQELVHEIVQKSMELFQILRTTQLPNAVTVSNQSYNERKAKLEETKKTLQHHFKQLRGVYTKVMETTDGLDVDTIENLVPIVGKSRPTTDGDSASDVLRVVTAEHRWYTEQLHARNLQVKEIIDQLRNLLWEINAMLTMKINKI